MKNVVVWWLALAIIAILITVEKIPNTNVLQYLNFYSHTASAICIILFTPFVLSFASIIFYIFTTITIAIILSKMDR